MPSDYRFSKKRHHTNEGDMIKHCFILFFCALAFCGLAQQAPQKLPAISTIHNIYKPDQLLQEALPAKGKIVLIFYDPGCGHCQELGAGIAKNIEKLGQTNVFFICMNDKEYVEGYVNMFAKGLKGNKRISFWKDPGVEFIEKFMPENYPATYVYDAPSKKLVKSFQGEGDVNKILPILSTTSP